MSPSDVVSASEELARRLKEDIELCRTREEHIRVSARANEAVNLLFGILQFLDERSSLSAPSDTSDIGPGLVG